MSETKTTGGAATATKQIKTPVDAFHMYNEAGKRALMAYIEAGTELGVQADRLTRLQASHAAAVSKELAEVVSASIETGIKAREAARKATIELIEKSASFAN